MDNFGTLMGHNIWQSVIVFAIVFAILKLVEVSSAEERSWSWSATLFALALLPMAAFLPGHGFKWEREPVNVEVVPIDAKVSVVTMEKMKPMDKVKAKAKFETSDALSLPDKEELLKLFLILWSLGTGIAFLRLGYASYNAYKLRHSAYPFAGVDGNCWPEDVEIAVSDEIVSPIVIGIFKPLILVPREFAYDMDDDELMPLLYHELAHVNRHDNILHFVERLILAIYWWNPVMHIIAGRIAEERELACDDRAAKKCGDNLTYAKSLLKGARKLMGEKKEILGLAVLRRESVLSKRVKRMTVSSALEDLDIRRFIKNLSMVFMVIMATVLLTPRIAIGQVEFDKSELNSVEMSKDGVFLEVEWRGNIEFDEYETRVIGLDNDGYFSVITEQDGSSRKLIVTSGDNGVETRYLVNGQDHVLDEVVTAWQADSIKQAIRLSGINAEDRVDRIYSVGGVKAVLDEIALLHSDYALRLHTEALVEIYQLEQDEIKRLIALIDKMESDYEKNIALTSIADEQDLDGETVELLANAVVPSSGGNNYNSDIQLISEAELDLIEQEIQEEIKNIPSEEDFEKMRGEIEREMENFPTAEELARMREEALANLPTEEELKRIREDALADMPTGEELEQIQKEAMDHMLTREELEKIRLQAIESIPSAEELEKIRRDVIENMLTEEDIERIRAETREALKNLPTKEEIEKIKKEVRDSLSVRLKVREAEEVSVNAVSDSDVDIDNR